MSIRGIPPKDFRCLRLNLVGILRVGQHENAEPVNIFTAALLL